MAKKRSRRMTRREFLKGTTAAGVALGFGSTVLGAACGATPTPKATKPPGATPVPPTSTPAEEITLTFWYSSSAPPLVKGIEELAAKFEKAHPNVKMVLESFPFGEYFQKLATAWAAGGGPDVFWGDVTFVADYAYHETVIPLEDFMDEKDKEDLKDYYPGPLADMTYQGKVWSMALHQSTEAILYHEDMLDEAGIRKPRSADEAWTWEEFLDATKKLTKRKGDVTEVWGFTTHYSPSLYSLQPFIYQNGGRIISPDGSTFDGYLNSSETIEAIQFFAGLWAKHKVAPVERIPDIFQAGKVALYLANPFVLRDIDMRYPDLKIGVAPHVRNKKNAVQSGAWNVSIPKNSKHPDLAWEFAKLYAGKEGHKFWIDTTGYMPARKSAYEALAWVKEYPWNIFMEGLIEFPVHRPQTVIYAFMQDTLNDMLKDVMLGKDARTAVEEAVAKLEPEQKKYPALTQKPQP